ncbi:MAG TPA: YbdD/YjiX family protein [Gemmatimonadaceae bacterium]|nr:YbdD/YjiX family protein [Gemmatimonadaceae bacterium]
MRRVAELLARAAGAIRRVIGAPDYAAYLAHVRGAHPGATPLTRDAFVRDVLTQRYERPGSRCC